MRNSAALRLWFPSPALTFCSPELDGLSQISAGVLASKTSRYNLTYLSENGPGSELTCPSRFLGLVFEFQSHKTVHVEDRNELSTPWVASLPRASSASGSRLFVQWHELVETYTECSLTFASDKLPAISGAAERINQITSSVYLAGLWKYVIAQDLFWSVDIWGIEKVGAFTLQPPVPTENGCPSW